MAVFVKIWKKGYGVDRIFREMNLKEQHFVKCFCFGNVSMKNVVRSAVRSLGGFEKQNDLRKQE